MDLCTVSLKIPDKPIQGHFSQHWVAKKGGDKVA